MVKLKGMKSTLLCLIAVTGLFSLLIHFQMQWQSKLTLVNFLVYPLLIVTAIFATQFNRSRIAILCGFWLLFLVATSSPSINTKPLMVNARWLLLYGANLLLLLALIKDRALFICSYCQSAYLYYFVWGDNIFFGCNWTKI